MKKHSYLVGVFVIILLVMALGGVFSQDVYAKFDNRGVAFASTTVNDKLCEIGDCSSGRISGLSLVQVSLEYPEESLVYKVVKKSIEAKETGVVSISDFVILSNLEAESFNFLAGNLFDIGSLVGSLFNHTIKVAQVHVVKLDGITKVIFEKENGILIINENSFSNIVPSNSSFVSLDNLGQVVACDFVTGELGQDYVFLNTKVFVPAGSRVQYVSGVILIDPPVNATFDRLPSVFDLDGFFSETTIKGENILLPNGRVLDSGSINYRAGKFYVKEGEYAVIDGIDISGSGQVDVFFDGEEHSGDYVSLGKEKVLMATSENDDLVLNFGEKNGYFENEVNVRLKEKESIIQISKVGRYEKLPEIRSDAKFDVKTGELFFNKHNNERIYCDEIASSSDSSKMTIVSGDDKIISVGENSGYSAYIVRGEQASRRLIEYNRNELEESKEGYQKEYYRGGGFVDRLTNEQGEYLSESQKILLEALLKKHPELKEGEEYLSSLTNPQLVEESVNSVYNKYFLTPDEAKQALAKTKYSGYYNVLNEARNLHILYRTEGQKERVETVRDEAVGIRQVFFNYY